MTVGAVVLAAGRSTRMGGANKLLADLGGAPVIARTVEAVLAAGLPALIVTGHMASEVTAALTGRGVRLVAAPDYAAGMSRSLAAGLAAAPAGWHAALIVLGDMPLVAPATLTALAAAVTGPGDVAVPATGGRRGNPVAWGRAWWPRLAALTGDSGGKPLLAALGGSVREIAVDDPGILTDVDTPDALQASRHRFGRT